MPAGEAAVDRSLAHLLGRVALVEVAVRRAVLHRADGDPEPGDPLRGAYLSDSYVRWLLERSEPPARGEDDDTAELRRRLEADADAAEAAGADLRLRRLTRTFDLDPLEEELLLVAVAPGLDPRFRHLFGYLNDDVARTSASVLLAVELATGHHPGRPAQWLRLSARSPLHAHRLLEPGEEDLPLPSRSVRVAERVLTYLLGSDEPDPALEDVVRSVEPLSAVDPAFAELERPPVLLVRQRPGTLAAVEAATWVCATRGTSPLVVALPAEGPDEPAADLLDRCARESLLSGRSLVVGPVDRWVGRERPLAGLRRITATVPPLVLWGTTEVGAAADLGVAARVDLRVPAPAHRCRAWESSCTQLDVPTAALRELSEQHRIGAGVIARAVAAARTEATATGRAVDAAALRRGVRAQDDGALQSLSRRVRPRRTWDDLVLPAGTRRHLRELVDMVRCRDQLAESWGLARGGSARGVAALFVGPSGTGKTLAAEVVAHELGVDLYAVDLARVVDKYVGETEKNLERVLSAAEGVTGLLFFDECDALFGRRSEVRQGQDRYANLEVSYLLQRVEDFGGVVVLATNLRSHVDEAFVRRLDALVEFPPPDAASRERMWHHHLARVDVDAAADLAFCATAFDLSGGNIRNVAAVAACLAGRAGRPVTMSDLVRGVEKEQQKLGRLRVPADFGRYADLLGGES